MLQRGNDWFRAVLLVACGVSSGACGSTTDPSPQDGQDRNFGNLRQALTSEQTRVLGFETPTADWSSNSGTLASTANTSQGSAALAVTPAGWTEINSISLSTLDNVRETLSYDVYLPQVPGWGETRAILISPTLGQWWAELGSRSLTNLPAGQFSTVSFTIPPSLRTALGGSYSDLKIKLVINAEVLSQPYIIDNLVMTEGTQSGGGGGPPGGELPENAIFFPRGHSIGEVLFSAHDDLVRIADRVRLERGLGAGTPLTSSRDGGVDVGVDARTFDVISEGDINLRNYSLVRGDATTGGDVFEQAGAFVSGDKFTFETIEFDSLTLSVDFTEQPTSSVTLAPEESRIISPGRYSQIVVERDCFLTLRPGRYVIDDLIVNAGGKIVISNVGRVVAAVQNGLTFHGRVIGSAGSNPDWLLAYLGSQFVAFEQAFRGTIVAPNAAIALGSTEESHVGSFFAAAIEARPGSLIVHQPFMGWAEACDAFNGAGSVCDGTGGSTAPVTISDLFPVNFPIGGGQNPDGVSVFGSDGVSFGNGSGVTAGGGGGVVLAGPGGATLGNNASIPGLLSQGDVAAGSGVSSSGGITSGGSVSVNGGLSSGSGAVSGNANVAAPSFVGCATVFGPSEQGDILLEDGRARIALPGNYGTAIVKAGAKLYLKDGEYHFERLVIEDGASLFLNGGLTVAYVRTQLALRGDVLPNGKIEPPEFFVGFAGTSPVEMSGEFRGALYAPSAAIQMGENLSPEGTFFGATVNVGAGTNIHHLPLDFEFVCGLPIAPTGDPIVSPSDIELFAYVNHATNFSEIGTFNPAGLIEFRVPKVLHVEAGNAGNHPATLRYVDANNNPVTCSYQGGASTPHPITRAELAKGTRYEFLNCSNGVDALEETTGREFSLEIAGDAQAALGNVTSVGLALSKGKCQKQLGSFIPPGEAIEMLESFSWFNTSAVDPENDDGSPALYYANIYVKSQSDIDLVNALLIHNQPSPLFYQEYPEELFGGCGAVSGSGDFGGEWLFAVIPGAVYNELRRIVIDTELEIEGNRVLFDAIVLRPVPIQARNTNGSLSYQFLTQEAGFQWTLNGTKVASLPDSAALNATALQSGGAVVIVAFFAFELVVEVATEAVALAMEGLAYIDSWLSGTVRVRVDVDVQNLTPSFGGAVLRRGWGPLGGTELAPWGATVSLFQVVSRVYTVGLPMPTLYRADMNRAGQVSFDVAQNSWTGGTIYGGLCITLENRTSRFSHFILPDQICDFPSTVIEGVEIPGLGTGGGFSEDTDRRMHLSDDLMVAFAEFNEGRDYAHEVLGVFPAQAKVRPGFLANVGAAFSTTATTLCSSVSGFDLEEDLNLEQVGAVLSNAAILDSDNADFPLANFYRIFVGNSDILLPNGTSAGRTRGIGTHEYGHFVLCNYAAQELPFLNAGAGARSAFFRDLWATSLFEGKDVDEGDDARIINEAFADFYAGQVMGGTNYFGTQGSQNTGSMDICTGLTSSCVDQNAPQVPAVRGGSNPGFQQIARLTTLLHDVFDGHYGNSLNSTTKTVLTPTNADFHRLSSKGTDDVFAYTPFPYGDLRDDSVASSGLLLRGIVSRFLDRALDGATFEFDVADMRNAIAAAMRANGVSWCEACEVMALHEPFGHMSLPDQWETCVESDFIDGLGPVPDADLAMAGAPCAACGIQEVRARGEFCRLLQFDIIGPCSETHDATGQVLPGTDVADPNSPTGARCSLAGGAVVPGRCANALDGLNRSLTDPVNRPLITFGNEVAVDEPGVCNVIGGAQLAGPCASTTTGTGVAVAGTDVNVQVCELLPGPPSFSGCPDEHICVRGPCSNVTDALGRQVFGLESPNFAFDLGEFCAIPPFQEIAGPCELTLDGVGQALPGANSASELCELTGNVSVLGPCNAVKDALGAHPARALEQLGRAEMCNVPAGSVVAGPCASITNGTGLTIPGSVDNAMTGTCTLPTPLDPLFGSCATWVDGAGAPLPGAIVPAIPDMCLLASQLVAGPCSATEDASGAPLPGTDVATACMTLGQPIPGACPDIISSSGNRLSAVYGALTLPSGEPTCQACAPWEFANRITNQCEPCPPGQVIGTSGECVPCAANEVPQDNVCVECPFGTGPSQIDRNHCAACGPDQVINLGSACTDFQFVTGGGAESPFDNCPGQFWVNVFPANGTKVLLYGDVAGDPGQALCDGSQFEMSYFDSAGVAITSNETGAFCSGELICDSGPCQLGTEVGPFLEDNLPSPFRVHLDIRAANGSPMTPSLFADVFCDGETEQAR